MPGPRCISRTAATSSPTASTRWCAIRRGRLIDEDGHLDRLDRSLQRAAHRLARASGGCCGWSCASCCARNGVRDGLIYLQVTRGVAPRDFRFPAAARPTLVMTTRPADAGAGDGRERACASSPSPTSAGSAATSSRSRCCPTCWASSEAAERGAFEAWQVDEDGMVTEGTSSNAWIVTADGELVTRPAGHEILNGITRQSILRIAAAEGAALRRAAVQPGGGYCRARGLPQQRHQLRHAGRCRSTTARSATARPGRSAERLLEAYVAHAARVRGAT